MLLLVAGLQRFTFGLGEFEIINLDINPFQNNRLMASFVLPIYYLFFYSLLYKRASFQKMSIHLIVPIIIVGMLLSFTFDASIPPIVFFIYSTSYIFLMIRLFWIYLKQKKTSKQLVYSDSIKSLSLFMLLLFFIIYLVLNYIYISQFKKEDFDIFNEYYKLTSIIWFIIIIYILKNPVIIYGEQLLTDKINQAVKNDINVWRSNKKPQTEEFDLDLEKKLKGNIDKIIFSIKNHEANLLDDFVSIPSLKELAFKLDYPQSHIKYILKYYSFYTYKEYQNAIKVKYAMKLIKAGFLDAHTIDSLLVKCLYSNRSTFFKNFKNLTGYSPTEYAIAFAGKQ